MFSRWAQNVGAQTESVKARVISKSRGNRPRKDDSGAGLDIDRVFGWLDSMITGERGIDAVFQNENSCRPWDHSLDDGLDS